MKIFNIIFKALKWLVYGLGGILGIAVLGVALSYLFYLNWSSRQLDALAQGSQIAQTSAGPVEYLLTGNSGPVMLFIHGRPGGYDSAPPPREDMRILTPSRPGYLRTPLATGHSPAEQATAYAALLDALLITDPVIVQAASAGGPSAITFAARYPERVAALVLAEVESQRPELPETTTYPIFLRNDFMCWFIFSALENLMGTEAVINFMAPDSDNRELLLQDPQEAEKFAALIWALWPLSQRLEGAYNDGREFSVMELPVNAIHVPVFIIHGTADRNVPFADSEKLAASIPGAEFHAVAGGDHWMPWTHKAEVSGAIEGFLKAQGALRR